MNGMTCHHGRQAAAIARPVSAAAPPPIVMVMSRKSRNADGSSNRLRMFL